jgi:hypothetical protein
MSYNSEYHEGSSYIQMYFVRRYLTRHIIQFRDGNIHVLQDSCYTVVRFQERVYICLRINMSEA